MNVTIIIKPDVKNGTLDDLSRELPAIISKIMHVPGGRMAIVRPQEVYLHFCQASVRDIGSDIKVEVFARSNDSRTSAEDDLAREALDRITSVIRNSGEDYSVDIRIYLMEIGAANYSPGS